MSNNILLEIDEAMRWERIEKFWKANGNAIIAFVLLTVLGTAVLSGYNAWNEHVRSRETAKLLALVEDPRFPANAETAMPGLKGSLRGIALMNAGAGYIKDKKNAEAIKSFAQAANDASISPDIRQLAILMRARLLAQEEKPAEDPLEALMPLVQDQESPWHAFALLEGAALAAERRQDYARAQDYLSQIINAENLPDSLVAKARALSQIYSGKGKTVSSEKADQTHE